MRPASSDEISTDHFQAIHVATTELQWVSSGEAVAETREWMTALDISVAPCRCSGAFRVVEARQLQGADPRELTAEFQRPLGPDELVPSATPLSVVLAELKSVDYLFVHDGGVAPVGVVTKWDLGRSAVTTLAFWQILQVELGLRRLLGTFTNKPIPAVPERAREAGTAGPKYFRELVKSCALMPELVRDLGYENRSAFESAFLSLADLRNDLAHGRGPVVTGADAAHTIERLDGLAATLERVERMLSDREQVWNAFADTVVIADDGAVWAGPGATALPFHSPVHVINALNPYEAVQEKAVSDRRNEALRRILVHRGVEFRPCVGRARGPGAWEEPSFLVVGLGRGEVLSLAKRFGQRAIFELTDEELRVVSVTGEVRRKRPRDN